MIALKLSMCRQSLAVLAVLAAVVVLAGSGCQDPAPASSDSGALDALADAPDGAMVDADATDAAGIDTDAPDQSDDGKPYCKGSWMCAAGKCTHILDSQPAIGRYMPNFNLLREKDGSVPGIMAATFYNKLDADWQLVTAETALMELKPDGEFHYLSEALPGAVYGIPARTAGGALAMASVVSQTDEPADPHRINWTLVDGEYYIRTGDMLIVSRLDASKKLVNIAALGDWVPAHFAGTELGNVVELVAVQSAMQGTPESALGPRVFVIDLETGVSLVDKPFLGGKLKDWALKGFSLDSSGLKWGVADLKGQRVYYEWAEGFDGKLHFSISKLNEKFEIISKSADLVGATLKKTGMDPLVDHAGGKLYIANMFGGMQNLTTVTAAGVVEQLPVNINTDSFPKFTVLPSGAGGTILCVGARDLYGLAADGSLAWKNDFRGGTVQKRGRAEVQVNDGEVLREYIDWYFESGPMISLGGGKFAGVLQLAESPILNPGKPFEPGKPPNAANVAPYYLYYFDENGKPLCN